jgi:hypothetical protein
MQVYQLVRRTGGRRDKRGQERDGTKIKTLENAGIREEGETPIISKNT